MRYQTISFFLLFVSCNIYAQEVWLFSQANDDLFNKKYVDLITTMAEELNLTVKTFDPARSGAPEMMHTTPAILFKSDEKCTLYSGRYTELDALKLFFETAAYLPSDEASDCREAILVKKDGRSNIGLRLKMTPLNGPLPADKKGVVSEEISNSIQYSFSNFELEKNVCFTKSDRIFYLDVHPYAIDSLVYITVESYSPYHCVIPIIDAQTHSIPLENIEKGIKKIMLSYENRLADYIRTNNRGDAFTPISSAATTMIIESNAGADAFNTADMDWSGNWSVQGSKSNPIIYQFPAPLDRYRATFNRWEGSIVFDSSLSGEFIVDVKSLDTGVSDFTEKVLKKYLKAKKYPKAIFSFSDQAINPKSTEAQSIEGIFQFKGKTKKISAIAVVRAIQENDEPKLLLQAQFQIPLIDFQVEQPDGPEEAASVVNIFANTLLTK